MFSFGKGGDCRTFCCQEMLGEVRQKLRAKFGFPEEQAEEMVKGVEAFSKMVEIEGWLRVVRDDPDDDKVGECAKKADADFIVSGDRHLLSMGKFESIPIVKARDFLRIVAGEEGQK